MTAPRLSRLTDSGSVYLLQHAANPVDWHPWGPEAFERARREDKPIFLSIGYSSCHWCHVANRTLFSDPEIAELMNRWFVNVKVDREQRPDVDAIYLLATRLLTGRAGWPNNVFLTPEGKPFFAGSYFPPSDEPDRPGFPTVLRQIHESWVFRRAEMEAKAEETVAAMRRVQLRAPARVGPGEPRRWWAEARRNLAAAFDPGHGGFRRSAQEESAFPMEPVLALLAADFRQGRRPQDARRMLVATLDAMAAGGIHDHVGGGFHRYSIERSWSLPHFEKMLYTNAQVLKLYAEAWPLTRRPWYRDVARSVGGYLLERMQAPEGGFFAAEDAEAAGEEGGSYLWSAEEIHALLGEDAARGFFEVYELVLAAKPATLTGGEPGVLRMRRAPRDSAPAAAHAPALAKLRAARAERPQPLRDEKLIVSWNGLAIEAFAVAGRILGEAEYLRAARRAAERIWKLAYDSGGGRLRHEIFQGEARGEGFLDDYALFGNGLAALADATGERRWRMRARTLAEDALRLFSRPDGSLAKTLEEKEFVVPPEESGDLPYPAGASAMLALLGRLERAGAPVRDRAAGQRILGSLAFRIAAQPQQWPLALGAALAMRHEPAAKVAAAQAGAAAAGEGAAAPADSRSYVQVSARVRRGAAGDEIAVRLRIAPGFHVNANPATHDFLVPTRVRFERFAPTRIAYPEAKIFRPAFASGGIAVYEGEIEIVAHAPAGALARGRTRAGRVEVQACDEQLCFAPATLPFAVRASSAGEGGGGRKE